MQIQTKRLIITELTMDMVQAVHTNSLDEDNRKFVPDDVFETLSEAEEVVTYLIGAYQGKSGPYVYPVVLKNGINIGYVQACQIESGWEIGYHIAKAHNGKGYATEAVNAFLPEIMTQLNIPCIYGIVLEENTASHRVLEKCGFTLCFRGNAQYQGQEKQIKKYLYESLNP